MNAGITENERRTLETCLHNLGSLQGCEAEFVPGRHTDAGQGILQLSGPWGKLTYHICTRLRLSAANADVVIHQLKAIPGTTRLLVSDYISEDVGRKLRDSGVDFVDAAGNASLHQPPLYVELSGRKRLSRAPRSGRAFQTAGLKLVFFMLRLPQSARWTYRDLARESGVALGAVGPILQDLEKLGYLQTDHEQQRTLTNLDDLLLRWELGYGERLRNSLHPLSCRMADDLCLYDLPDLIRRQELDHQVLLGGELGALRLLQEEGAAQVSLHYAGDQLKTMLRLQLIPDPEGQVQMIQRFGSSDDWQGSQPEGAKAIDPLLVHAELVTLDSGRKALPQQLYNRYLAPRFKGNRVENRLQE